MQVKTKAIVISTLKFQEKSLIVKCFTQSDGLKSYFVRNAFSSQKTLQSSSNKMAYFQLLNILEIEAHHKNKGTLEHFKEVKLSFPYQSINTNIFKSTIVIFLSEVLHHSIKEEEKNENLFLYLETALQWLDTNDEVSNFHLILLLEITKYLGFYPDISQRDLAYFETIEGVFSPLQGTSCLSQHQTSLFNRLIDVKFEDNQKNFAAAERQILLKILLDYYAAHLDGFKKPKSLEVLKEVFT
ncbi:DNA repair protein RecO [uncultured Flavobacterium sp.]|uniref:DNA repair protein RecO n=1 Tax=uncultured Flavobacterium sp. TaxID=165435 RepID=UPI0030CA2726|tara:strand:- start:1886 stop:2611 length:726 start_codon:yes stop_codon:yes gene_type:complete